MKKFVLIGCLLALSGQVMAANWILLDINHQYIMYGDTESRTDDKAWFKWILLKTEKRNGRDVKESKHYVRANCSTNQMTLLSITDYDRSGSMINSSNAPSYLLDSVTRYVIPDSVGERMFKFICNREPS
ncbi:surface-adhesin E family protein [Conchiformibius steedae]|uniref:Surface-adhesin protein E-like domain-containing protein n=1 Tax=Conchiformibius steedae TaxID=153493 RepID=A0A3P2A641_9NEIS|nr:surface-adhesin E family protein [Conchiformibius steedae]RRD90932.1 hypothetical protein EII21_02975 [Conchiformibius steedae]